MQKFILALLLSYPVIAFPITSFEEAYQKALESEKTATKDYKRRLITFFTGKAIKEFLECRSNSKNAEEGYFNIIFRIVNEGSVDTVWLNQKTPITTCFKNSILKLNFPAPPNQEYYFHAGMNHNL